MKAMVLAAGLGTRLRPLSLLRAKPALPVLNRPLLHWTLELLARHGVRQVVINLHHLPQTITSVVGDGSAFGLRVCYSRERTILGTGGGPRRVRHFFGEEPFLLVNGDMVFDFDLTRLVSRHRAAKASATLALLRNPDPRRYGPVVTAADGRVVSIAGLPRPARGHASLFAGVHVMDPALLERLPAGVSDSVRDLYPYLIEAGERLIGLRMEGPWFDISSPRLYLESQLALLRGGSRKANAGVLVDRRASIDPKARVRRSIIAAGARVDAGALVEDSVLWENVRIGSGARVRRSIVADRVVVAPGESLREKVALRRGPATARVGRRRGDRREVGLSA
jgi:NDP-sugar pyrophosphorylase family protein